MALQNPLKIWPVPTQQHRPNNYRLPRKQLAALKRIQPNNSLPAMVTGSLHIRYLHLHLLDGATRFGINFLKIPQTAAHTNKGTQHTPAAYRSAGTSRLEKDIHA